jgi:hypothetical protein
MVNDLKPLEPRSGRSVDPEPMPRRDRQDLGLGEAPTEGPEALDQQQALVPSFVVLETQDKGGRAGASRPVERAHFAFWVATAFTLLTLPRLLSHELWRDEAWLWQVVLDSSSVKDLAGALGRTGQGYLFPFLCFFAQGVTASWRALQFVNLVLAASGAFAFARWAPFGRGQRILFVLSYLPFYEYAVISRHYAAGAFLLWLACAAGRRGSVIGLGLALGLLCQTTVYGFILALAVAAACMIERLGRPGDAVAGRWHFNCGWTLAGIGASAGLLQLIPEPDTGFAPGWRFSWQPEIFVRMLQIPWRAFVPIPQPELTFWNSNVLDPWPILQAAAGLVILIGAVVFLWPRRLALTIFVVGAVGLLGFGYVKFLGAIRHDGHLWLLFVAALWLGGGIPKLRGQVDWRTPTFVLVLIAHVAAGAFASWIDLNHPFSNAARIAQILKDRGLERERLLGYREPPAAPVALALGRPLFFPSRGLDASYPDWGPQTRELPPEELRCIARDLAVRESRDIILVMNQELPHWPETEEIGAALGAIQATEDYRLYRLTRARLEATADQARCPGTEAP